MNTGVEKARNDERHAVVDEIERPRASHEIKVREHAALIVQGSEEGKRITKQPRDKAFRSRRRRR